jgi:hypothetical protein
MANNYVKFMRGTLDKYNSLVSKDNDTLYFLTDPASSEGWLYLGTKLISGPCPGMSPETLNLNDLLDVVINEEKLDKEALLMFNTSTKKWENWSFDSLVFSGPTATVGGLAGLVPAPKKNEYNLFLRSDGTWAKHQTFEAVVTEGQSHDEAIVAAIGDNIINDGDIVIVQDLIYGDKYQYTSYTYSDGNWKVLNSNYDVELAYFKSDLTFADPITGDQKTLEAKGKNINQVVEALLSEVYTPNVVGDNSTITLDGKTLSLKDFGKQYYKYVAATGEEGSEAHYELQLVDDEHPWMAGLEPRVVVENGTYTLGWYEPNPTTMDGVKDQITNINNEVQNIKTSVSNLSTNLNNTYTKTETDEKIATAISGAAHLKRTIVQSTDDIDVNAADAEQYIYMVPSGFTAVDDKYDEYMVIEVDSTDDNGEPVKIKKIEKVGSWEVDLDGYVSVDDFTAYQTSVNNTLTELSNNSELNYINSVSESFKVESGEGKDRQLQLVSIPKTIDLSQNSSLANLFTNLRTEVSNAYVSHDDLTQLNIETGAEKNKIVTTTEEFAIDPNERKLSLVSVAGTKISELDKNTVFAALATKVGTNTTDIQAINNALNGINDSITQISNTFGNYVTTEKHNSDLASIWEHLVWQELGE